MMSWSSFSPAQCMKTEEEQEKGDEGCQGIILHSTSIMKYENFQVHQKV